MSLDAPAPAGVLSSNAPADSPPTGAPPVSPPDGSRGPRFSPAAARPGRRSRTGSPSHGARLTGRVARRFVSLVVIVAVWQLLCSTGHLAPTTIASPATVASSAGHLISDGELPSAMWASLHRVIIGLLLGGSVGIVLAFASGLSRLGEDVVDAPVQMLRTVPFAGLVPLFIVWFGIGETSKVALVALAAVFPLYLNVLTAIRGTDVQLVEMARTLGLGRLALIRRVILPGALPGLLLGLRISLGVSWLAVVFAEQVNALNGLGALMSNAQELFQTQVIVVCLVTYALLGLAADFLVRGLERGLLRWRADVRSAL